MGDVTAAAGTAVARLGAAIRDAGWELALEVVHEGLQDDQIPSLERLDLTQGHVQVALK